MPEETSETETFAVGGTNVTIPKEVTLTQAVKILGVARRTVTQYMDGGLLEWRDIAPPKSSRPTFRLKLESVLRLRTDYQTGAVRTPPAPVKRVRFSRPRLAAIAKTFKHLRFVPE